MESRTIKKIIGMICVTMAATLLCTTGIYAVEDVLLEDPIKLEENEDDLTGSYMEEPSDLSKLAEDTDELVTEINPDNIRFSSKSVDLSGAGSTRFLSISYGTEPPKVTSFWDKYGIYNVAYKSGDNVIIKRFDSNLNNLSNITIRMELPLFGNVVSDGDFYYVITGKNDEDECRNCVVNCVAKYDISGNKIECLDLTGKQTVSLDGTCDPFWASTCDASIQSGVLVCIYGRKMFNGHQSSYTFYVDTEDMTVLEGDRAYTSHSFDQAVLPTSDGGYLLANQGDAFYRGFMLSKADCNRNSINNFVFFHFREGANRPFGYNETFSQLGGIAETYNEYVLCGSSENTLSYDVAPTNSLYSGHSESRNVFVQAVKKDFPKHAASDDWSIKKAATPEMFAVNGETREATGTRPENAETELYLEDDVIDYNVIWLTNYNNNSDYACNPKVVWDENGHVIVLWERLDYSSRSGETYYAIYDESFNVIKSATKLDGTYLPGNANVIYHNGKLYWTTNDDYGSNIRILDLGLTKEKEETIHLVNNNIEDHYKSTYQLELTSDSTVSMEDIIWESGDEEIATVDSNGLVTVGYKKGSTDIIGRYKDSRNSSVKCHVTVKPYNITYMVNEDDGYILYELAKRTYTTQNNNNPYVYYPKYYYESSLLRVAKCGYRFDGWYTDPALKNYFSVENEGDVVLYPSIAENSIYIAFYEFKQDGTYGYSKYGGTITTGMMPAKLSELDSLKTNVNNSIKSINEQRISNNQPPLEFDYFSTDKDGKNKITEITIDDYNFRFEYGEYTSTTSKYLYPHFKEKSGYDITYNLFGGVNNSRNITSIPVVGSGTFTLLNPTRSGYTFEGWYTSRNYQDTEKITTIDYSEKKEITLYAKWSKNNLSSGSAYGICGENVEWFFDESDSSLTISGSGPMDSFGSGAPWKAKVIKNVTIGEGVTSIGNYSFNTNSTIEKLTLPSTLESIGYGLFSSRCRAYSIYIPSWSSMTKVSYNDTPFRYAEKIYVNGVLQNSNVTFPEDVTVIPRSMFANSTYFTGVSFSGSNVTIDYSAFSHNEGITSLSLKNVSSIGYNSFAYCNNLTGALNIGKETVSINVNAFYGCGFSKIICEVANPPVGFVDGWNYKTSSEKFTTLFGGSGESDLSATAKIDSVSLTIDGTTNLCFIFDISSGVSETGKLYIGNAVYDIKDLKNSNGQYVAIYPVPAKELKIKNSIYCEDGFGNRIELINSKNDRIEGDVLQYSVADYINAVKAGNYRQELKNFVSSLEKYGMAASNYFGLSNQTISITKNPSLLKKYETGFGGTLPEGVTYEGTSMVLKDRTRLRFYFKGNVSGCRAYYGGNELSIVKLGDKYFAETADISAPELGKIKDFILTDGKSTYIMGYCPLTYCGKAIKSDKETLVNIGYTMQEYYEASRAYFNLYK